MRLTDGASSGTYKYMADGIRYVCENFKDRCAGTHSERKAQQFFQNELENWSDEVKIEDFDVRPNAFFGWMPMAGVLCVISVIFYWLTFFKVVQSGVLCVISVIFSLFAMACFLGEFLFYRRFIDFLFPERTSRNVTAARKSAGETKRRIIFCGHTDASHEWTYSLHGGLKSLACVIGGAVSGLIILCLFNIFWLVYHFASGAYTSNFWLVLGVVQLAMIPFFIAIMFFINWNVVVDGANDNLSASYIAVALMKELAEKGKRYENTEVCCLLTGSQEAGLRGALEYAQKHLDTLKEIETVVVAMDTMREIDQLQIYTCGCTGTQKNSNAVGELLYEAGVNCGVEMKEAKIYTGASDCEAFSRYGIESAGMCAVNHNPKSYYHTRLDTYDNISQECINLSLDICLETVQLYDEKEGLDAFREQGAKRFKRGYNKD